MLIKIGRWFEETLDRLPGGAKEKVGRGPGRVRGGGFLVVLWVCAITTWVICVGSQPTLMADGGLVVLGVE